MYGGAPFEWSAHASRLRKTCDALGVGPIPDDLRERVDETLADNGLDDALVTLSITRGEGDVLTPTDADPTVVVAVEPFPRGGREGTRTWDEPAVLQTVKTRRVSDRAVPARAKTHSRLHAVLARRALRTAAGPAGPADEAMVLDDGGAVAGGAATTLFFVRDDALRTPGVDDAPVYPGVTRSAVIDIADREGIPVVAGRYSPDDVRNADEAFLAGTRWKLRPVETVDGIDVGAGPVTALLARRFDERIERARYG